MNRVLLLDNYDSFTYNLFQYLAELGADISVARNDEITLNQIEELQPERIVISPGPKRPEDAGISVDVVKHFAGRLPILGVCLGHQCIGAAYGAAIVRAAEIMHGKTSRIEHDGRGVYVGLPASFEATRYHSLVVNPETLPAELLLTSWSAGGVLMGLRHRQYALEGVQFHPESIMTSVGHDLLRNFLEIKETTGAG